MPALSDRRVAEPAYADLQDWVWARLPASRFLAGRRRVAALIAVAIDRWPDGGTPDRATLAEAVEADLRASYADRRIGSIWVILLASLIGELVRLLVIWWLSSDEHKRLFLRWRRRRDA